TITSFTQPGHGTLVLNANNTFTFTPAHNFYGVVTFQYTITDAEGETRTATDTIHVSNPLGLNAVNDAYSTNQNTPITFDSKVNDSNPDGTAFTITSFTQPGHGTLVLNADNTFTFTPAHNFYGDVTFNYTITDAEGETRTATDTIHVVHVNQGLNAVNDAYTTNQDTPITFDSKVNDSNPDGTPFSVTSFTQPGHGVLVLNADNTFTFTPAAGFHGDVSFQYTITDAEGEVRTATDTIHIIEATTPPPPPPPVCPLTIDLGGDGLTIISKANSSATFDFSGDGTRVHTAWVGPNEGILVHDDNNDGIVSGINEVYGKAGMDGFTEMAQLEDTNHDGVIDANDARFDSIKVWIDANSDGISDPGELYSLKDLGIKSISLNTVADAHDYGDAFTTKSADVTYDDGHTTKAADVWYRLDAPVDTSSVIGQQSEIVAPESHDTVAATPVAEPAAPVVTASSGAEVLHTAGLDDTHHA
ncbi:MAG TPA: tandem-95 repeat protein, partial [Alphaproteobacteria bacterium]|nr:tandem-95 repeat protein [Alphaproteobacteria bacterium]